MAAEAVTARVGWIHDWPCWFHCAGVAWSLVYAVLGLYWAMSGRGFPFATPLNPAILGPVARKF
jgi:hypothetical protein